MTGPRPGAPGATRVCPHCRQTILESAAVCPACRHHLRFEARKGGDAGGPASINALRVEGTIEHPTDAEPWEYSVLLSIRNERGEEIARHVANVGVLQADAKRSFTLAVELFKPSGVRV